MPGQGYTHFNKVSGVNGVFIGAAGSEVQIAGSTGILSQAGVAVTSSGAELNILTGATVTAAELNTLDISANTQTITAPGALSVVLSLSRLALTGAGAVTLAAPDASMVGKVKVIEMTVDNGDVTLSLANVAGGSAATTCTWSAVGQALVLVAGLTKWNVCSEGGVALT